MSDAIQHDRRLSWARSLTLAAVAVHGPFMVVAAYDQAFGSRRDFLSAAWSLLLPGPGIAPLELLRLWLHFSVSSQAAGLSLALMVAAGMIVGVAGIVRRGRAWAIPATVFTAVLSSVFAAMVLMLLRA